MKQLILTGLLALLMCQLQAQMCTPDELFRDSAVGVYPRPFSMDNPDGGITDTACINNYFEFTFTFKVPQTLTVSGFLVDVDSIVLDPNDPETIQGLPDGMDWSCNPGDCVFSFTRDSLACALIFGTPASTNAPGEYPLSIKTVVYTQQLGDLDLTFPNMLIPGADGTYSLTVEDENSSSCATVSTDDLFAASFSLNAFPNPVAYFTTIEVFAESNENLTFAVYDMLGREVHNRRVDVFEGKNNFEFDASNLTEGVYLYRIGNETGSISRKLIVGR